MRVLVTGNNGYIGVVLTKLLLKKGYDVLGLDTDYYSGCEFSSVDHSVPQIKKDIRTVSRDDLHGIDMILHLAALSNDPMGALNAQLTNEINFEATVNLARIAKRAGIERFIFASSCSLYGMHGDRKVNEEALLDPITEYAVSKSKSEHALKNLADDTFSPVFLRAGTAYGLSPMLRVDLVVNNLLGGAYLDGEIRIMSNGSPWRPLIHVEDLARGYIASIEAPRELIHNEAFNLGRDEDNYRIKDIADLIQKVVPDCKVAYTGEHGPDARTYRVDFSKINTRLGNYFKPQWNLKKGIKNLYDAYIEHGLKEDEFTGDKYIRLSRLKSLMNRKLLDEKLLWVK